MDLFWLPGMEQFLGFPRIIGFRNKGNPSVTFMSCTRIFHSQKPSIIFQLKLNKNTLIYIVKPIQGVESVNKFCESDDQYVL